MIGAGDGSAAGQPLLVRFEGNDIAVLVEVDG
jgi:hypothetical protein